MARSDEAGEPSPAEVRMGRGTLEDAMRTIDPSTTMPETPSPRFRRMLATPVVLVVMHGHFTLNDARVPPGYPAPTGAVLDLVIDAHTGGVIGRALPITQQQGGLPLASVASWKAARGVIVGRLYVAGGPPSRSRGHRGPIPSAGSGVVVTNISGKVVARTMTAKSGRFRIRIKPGRYLVAGTLSGLCKRNAVTVRAGKQTSTRLSCSIR